MKNTTLHTPNKLSVVVEVIWDSTHVLKEADGTFSVSTPIGYERGFSSQADAHQYANFGADKRKLYPE